MLNIKSVAILAGGESKRMPFNKEFLKEDDQFLIHKKIKELNKYFEEVIVVTNNPKFYKNLNCLTLTDQHKFKGPTEGLRVALENCQSDYLYLLAADMPNFSVEYFKYINNLSEKYQIYASINNGYIEPFHGVYHKDCLKYFHSDYLDRITSLYRLINLGKSYLIDLDLLPKIKNADLFYNINQITDLIDVKNYQKVEITKLVGEVEVKTSDLVVEKYPLTIYLNDQKLLTILTIPTDLADLVVGYLKSMGIINNIDEIKNIEFKDNLVYVKSDSNFVGASKEKILFSGCGTGTEFHEKLDQLSIEMLDDSVITTKEIILKLTKKLIDESDLFKATGGVHGAVYQVGDIEIFKEDIGRHNAVDKIIGNILNNNFSVDGVLLISGRISSEMILKCIFTKIKIIVSKSAPTSLAIKLAEKYGVTLIGFARKNKMNIYANQFRIKRS